MHPPPALRTGLPLPHRSPWHVHADLPSGLPPPRRRGRGDHGHVLLVPGGRPDLPLHAQLAGRDPGHQRDEPSTGIVARAITRSTGRPVDVGDGAMALDTKELCH